MTFVLLFSFDNYIDANLRMMQLQEEGISCWLKDENSATISPYLANSIGGIKLMVPEIQKERAADLLRTMINKEKENKACPHCGSLNVEYIVTIRSSSNWLAAIFSLVRGNNAMSANKMYHCFDCAHEFDMLPAEKKSV